MYYFLLYCISSISPCPYICTCVQYPCSAKRFSTPVQQPMYCPIVMRNILNITVPLDLYVWNIHVLPKDLVLQHRSMSPSTYVLSKAWILLYQTKCNVIHMRCPIFLWSILHITVPLYLHVCNIHVLPKDLVLQYRSISPRTHVLSKDWLLHISLQMCAISMYCQGFGTPSTPSTRVLSNDLLLLYQSRCKPIRMYCPIVPLSILNITVTCTYM